MASFPLGAGSEAWLAWVALSTGVLSSHSLLMRILVALILPTNIIGGAYAYPHLVKRAHEAVGVCVSTGRKSQLDLA